MDDRTLKGVTDPSSIWTVICMLVGGSKAFGLLFLEGPVVPKICSEGMTFELKFLVQVGSSGQVK